MNNDNYTSYVLILRERKELEEALTYAYKQEQEMDILLRIQAIDILLDRIDENYSEKLIMAVVEDAITDYDAIRYPDGHYTYNRDMSDSPAPISSTIFVDEWLNILDEIMFNIFGMCTD